MPASIPFLKKRHPPTDPKVQVSVVTRSQQLSQTPVLTDEGIGNDTDTDNVKLERVSSNWYQVSLRYMPASTH